MISRILTWFFHPVVTFICIGNIAKDNTGLRIRLINGLVV